jgi:hypothetical protein
VDDFLGTGQQIIQTWRRAYNSASPKSFAEAYALRSFPVFCIALVATETALKNVTTASIPITLLPVHVLDLTYSVQALNSPSITPPISNFQATLRSFLQRYAAVLTLEPFMKVGEHPLFGFSALGLTLAFEHGVPDSTLPVLWAPGIGNWTQLLRPQ